MKLDVDKVIKDINYMLNIASSKDFTKTECHYKIQYALTELSKKYELKGKREYFVNGHGGAIDVVWLLDSKPIAVFEIDSSRRLKSISKLSYIESDHKFWIYYGKAPLLNWKPLVDSQPDIHVIQHRIEFKRKSGKEGTYYDKETGVFQISYGKAKLWYRKFPASPYNNVIDMRFYTEVLRNAGLDVEYIDGNHFARIKGTPEQVWEVLSGRPANPEKVRRFYK